QLAMLRHADRVKIGCQTGGLAALAASNHDHIWKSASHFSFTQLIEYAKGTSMDVKVECETFDMPGYAIEDTSQYTGKEGVNYVDAASAWDKGNKRLAVFVINRNEDSDYPLTVDIKGFEGYKVKLATSMTAPDLEVRNEFGNEFIMPSEVKEYKLENGEFKMHVKPLSWNVLVFEG
nr:alpha-L-arabinofuranosidase [Lachnospiraceae bacterium]